MALGHGLAHQFVSKILMKASSKLVPASGLPGSPQDMSALTVLLNEEESFARAIELITASEDVQEQDPLTLQLKDAFARLDKQALEPALKEVLEIPTVKLWRAILDTETESYPNIEVSGRWSRLQMLMESFFSLLCRR
jgi:hypothetical protein